MIIHGFLGKFDSVGGFSIRWLPGEYCLHGWAPPPLRSALARPFLPLQNELHPNPKLPGACDRRRQALENNVFFLKKNKKFFIASNHSWNGQMQCELRVPRQDITWGLVWPCSCIGADCSKKRKRFHGENTFWFTICHTLNAALNIPFKTCVWVLKH